MSLLYPLCSFVLPLHVAHSLFKGSKSGEQLIVIYQWHLLLKQSLLTLQGLYQFGYVHVIRYEIQDVLSVVDQGDFIIALLRILQLPVFSRIWVVVGAPTSCLLALKLGFKASFGVQGSGVQHLFIQLYNRFWDDGWSIELSVGLGHIQTWNCSRTSTSYCIRAIHVC